MKKVDIVLLITLISSFIYANGYTIAFVQDTMANDFRKAQVEETKLELSKYKNINFIYSDAKAQTSLLIYQLDDFISKKVDIIILGTNDENAVIDSLEKAYNTNIPIIVLDRGVNTDKYKTFINSDNIKIGEIAGKYIADSINYQGTILLLEGLQTADVTKLRTKGFLDSISKYKKINVIKTTANYLRKDAIMALEKLILDGVKFDAIFSESDSMLSGARAAMIKNGINPKNIITVGCDYTDEAKKAIKEGIQTASIKFPLAGKEAAKIAIKILNKKDVEKHIIIPVKLVTKNNVNEVKPIF